MASSGRTDAAIDPVTNTERNRNGSLSFIPGKGGTAAGTTSGISGAAAQASASSSASSSASAESIPESGQASGSRDLIQFIKFALVGGMNTGVDFLVYSLLLWGNVYYILAQCISYSAGTLNSYVVNKWWTFESRGKGRAARQEFLRFAALNIGTLLLSLVLLYLCKDLLGIHPLLAKLFVTGITVVVNYIGSRLWVFR